MEAAIDAAKHAIRSVNAVGIALPGLDAGENFDAFRDPGNRQDLEFSGGDGADYVVPQHQVFNIFGRNHDALAPGKSLHAADVVETFDLLINSADRLDLAMLADRARNGNVLPDGQSRESRKQSVDLGRAGAIAVDAAVGLLEADAGGE